MRRLGAALVAVLVLVPAAPASADDSADRAVVERLLTEMAAEAEAELDRAVGDEPLPLEAKIARLEARVESLSRQIFAMRYEARRAVASFLPGLAGGDEPGISLMFPGAAMDLAGPGDVADLEAVVADWLRFEAAVDRLAEARDELAAAVDVAAPERVCPLPGFSEFENDWGEERGGRSHKGIDLHADFGSPLVAVEDGVVVQAGWHWAGGVQAYLVGAGSGDVYYYAHMTWWAPGIGPGSQVRAGDLIGWVGMSGNADSPHLHLGWMPRVGEVDLDRLANPYWMLRQLCG